MGTRFWLSNWAFDANKPCVIPVLSIVLASALQAGRHGPLAK